MRLASLALLLLPAWLSAGGAARAQSLAEAVELALERVPSLDAEAARVEAARQAVEVAIADWRPSLELTLAGHYGWRDEPTLSERFERHYLEGQATLELRQRLFDGGLTDAGIAAAEAEASAAAAVADTAAEDIAAQVVMAYLAAYEGERAVAIAAGALVDIRRLGGLVREQEQAGLLTPADRRQLEGRVALAEAELATAEGRRQVAAAKLSALTGEPVTTPSLPPLPLAQLPPDRAAALQQALAASPWLAEAAALERARLAERDGGEADFWPQVDLVVAGRFGRNLDGFEGQSSQALVLIELRWLIFDGFGREAEVRRLSHLGAAAGNELSDRHRLLRGRIDRDYAAMAEAVGRLSALDRAVRGARDTWVLYGQQFAIGRRSLLELLDARRDLARLEQQYLTAEILGPQAAYDLGAALGALRAWLRGQSVAVPTLSLIATPEVAVSATTGRLLAGLGASDAVVDVLPGPSAPLTIGVERNEVVQIAPAISGKLGAGPSLAELTQAALSAQ